MERELHRYQPLEWFHKDEALLNQAQPIYLAVLNLLSCFQKPPSIELPFSTPQFFFLLEYESEVKTENAMQLIFRGSQALYTDQTISLCEHSMVMNFCKAYLQELGGTAITNKIKLQYSSTDRASFIDINIVVYYT